ncbi:MAG: c-type cytochrome [Chloroflexota bacterium]
MIRSIAELAAYGTFAVLLTAASLAPETGAAGSAATVSGSAQERSAATRERGALLFATKGCIGCHVHSYIPTSRMSVGPDLSTVAERAGGRVAGLDARAYITQSLRDPRAFAAPGYEARMPDLKLSVEEVESLTAFLLGPAR